jgi:hypothetical protein
VPTARRLNESAGRAVPLEGHVRSVGVVIGDVLANESPEVAFAEHDDVVKELLPQRADKPLGERVRARR